MKILITPDKFKGSLTAIQVCDIIKSALMAKNPTHQIQTVPLADGGEGTCELLTRLEKGKFCSVPVLDPLSRKINAQLGFAADGKTAFIEMALASGLQLLNPEERNCMITTTYGTGQLIKFAVEKKVKEIIMGIGGSATNDAGIGMANALGYRFLSKSGNELESIGKNLIEINHINDSKVIPELKKIKFTILSDVTNPLFGKDGAAFVFAKQKGATADDIIKLDKGLQNFATVLRKLNEDVNFPGAGAAGGLGAGAKFFLNAQIISGIDFILDFTKLEEKIQNSDVIITGEGKIDTQTLSGKVVSGVAKLASKHNKKLVLIAGSSDLNQNELEPLKAAQVITLADDETSIAEAMQNPEKVLREKTIKIAF